MNIIALLQLLKNTEGGTELFKQTLEFAIKINSFERTPAVYPISMVRLGYDQTIIFAGMLYETAMKLPCALLNFGNRDMLEFMNKLFPKFKGEIDSLKKKFNANMFDNNFLRMAVSLCKLKSKSMPEEEGYNFSRKALKIYAPLAHRMGMHKLKDELEVLSFAFLYPNKAAQLEEFILSYYKGSDEMINSIRYKLKRELGNDGIYYISIKGRKKNLYRIYQKLNLHDKEMLAIHDIIALRIIVREMNNCYAVMRVIHRLWKPVKGRVKDYIVSPKANGYQSLHTTVYVGVQTVEFQIRTKEMDKEAEYGMAAHWFYEKNGSPIFLNE